MVESLSLEAIYDIAEYNPSLLTIPLPLQYGTILKGLIQQAIL